MSFLQLAPIIFGGMPGIIQYLRMHGLLASATDCEKVHGLAVPVKMLVHLRCRNVQMVEDPRTDMSDGISWYCPHFYTRKSIGENSFFTKLCLPLQSCICSLHVG